MDVHDRLEELVALVEQARAMPMSASCVVNRSQMLDLLEEVRELLPRNLETADRILADRDLIMSEARAEAERIIETGRLEQAQLVTDHEVYRAAVRAADQQHAEVTEEVTRMRREVDDYVDAKLANFEVALTKTLDAVVKGREKIRGRHEEYDFAPEELSDSPVFAGYADDNRLA